MMYLTGVFIYLCFAQFKLSTHDLRTIGIQRGVRAAVDASPFHFSPYRAFAILSIILEKTTAIGDTQTLQTRFPLKNSYFSP